MIEVRFKNVILRFCQEFRSHFKMAERTEAREWRTLIVAGKSNCESRLFHGR